MVNDSADGLNNFFPKLEKTNLSNPIFSGNFLRSINGSFARSYSSTGYVVRCMAYLSGAISLDGLILMIKSSI